MADTKITALAAITTVDPANDVLPIVDVSDTSMAASGTTKKITSNQILGAGGTATLASATITGNLTVDTNTLFVDATNNFVGVGTTTGVNLAAGRGNLTIGGSSSAILNLSIGAVDTGYLIHGGTDISLVNRTVTGALIFGVNSTTAMTLNSTGLGVGTSPSYKLHVFSASPILGIQDSSSAAGGVGGTINFVAYTSGTSGANIEAQIKGVKSSASSAGELQFFTSDSSGNSQQRLLIDGSGNPIFTPSSTPATLTTNGQLTVNATSNTNLRFSYRGSDGVTRTADITLA